MDEAKIAAFKGKVVRSSIALTGRTFLLQLISFGSTFVLTILLSPRVFGVFFVVSAVISFLNYFSDIGLAAALVQKKEDPDRTELVSVFTIQEFIVLLIIFAAFLLTPQISRFYSLSADGVFLLKALLVSFFLASLKTIPSILLERNLEFSRLVLPQILENIAFYAVAITLAVLNFEVASFAWAAIARGIIGTVAIYIVAPWMPGIGFSYYSVKKLISFGIPFQTNSLLALIKDELLTLYLGKILPFSYIGLLGWAKKWAEVPLRLIMDSVIKVTFPAFSRIQNNKTLLTAALNRTVFYLALFILPVSFTLIIYIKPLIYLIPKYQKWQPALFAFYLFAVSAIFSAFSSPVVNALNALGKIKKTLGLMVGWTILTWILVPFLTRLVGLNSWPVSSLIISLTVFIPVAMLKRFVSFNFLDNFLKPLLYVILMSFFSLLTLSYATDLLNLAVLIFISLLIYSLFIWHFHQKEIKPLITALR